MDDKTLDALKGSIEKWERIAQGIDNDRGTSNCPLCHLFHYNHNEDALVDCCAGCPVSAKTGQKDCKDTPYWEYVEAQARKMGDIGRVKSAAEAHKLSENVVTAAIRERDFLKSLLPETHQLKALPIDVERPE